MAGPLLVYNRLYTLRGLGRATGGSVLLRRRLRRLRGPRRMELALHPELPAIRLLVVGADRERLLEEVQRDLELPLAVVAETHVVERDVVLANLVARLLVEGERVRVVPDAVVEPPNLEGDVLVFVKNVVVLPHSRDAPSQVCTQLLPTRVECVQNRVSELPEHVGIKIAQLQQGHDGLQAWLRRVLLQALLHHEEVVRTERHDALLKRCPQVRPSERAIAVPRFEMLARPRPGVFVVVLAPSKNEAAHLERRFLLRVVQRESPP
mmetsp:Transcript_3506/g.13862  ORF Transcript_3506/g.13862 Transcript_3506/m.13862 type:complete len:265 (-) Transcript_3506:1160-1954(-)|eukprot:scaffold895_cov315-Pinguiococcus_pyrenoidosus.AAC.5